MVSTKGKRWWTMFDISTRKGRDLVLFLGGLLGVLHETFYTTGDRQYLLIFFGVMMGLPAYLSSAAKGEARSGAKHQDGPGG